ncbi:MAG: hypothetical protein GF365_03900 [Candidatus Buchananbacteria bacterium]|jgi:hypothetical protein|nr:hypothetical protein [Candidatus Buchananbacteria bacterium]
MLFYNISKFLDNPYREDLVVKISFILSLIINIMIWLALYFKLYPFSYLTEYGQIYLHYNIYFGIDSIGPWYIPFVIPALGLFIILFNNILAYIFYLTEKIISYVLIISQTVLQTVLLAAAVFVILLNI